MGGRQSYPSLEVSKDEKEMSQPLLWGMATGGITACFFLGLMAHRNNRPDTVFFQTQLGIFWVNLFLGINVIHDTLPYILAALKN